MNEEEAKFTESLRLYNTLFTQATADLFASWEKPTARIKEFFTTIDEGEDPAVEMDSIGSTVGKLAYSAVALFDKRLKHEVPDPEPADFDTDIAYPFETRTFLNYMAFAYDFFYEFLNFAMDMPNDTYLNACDQSI